MKALSPEQTRIQFNRIYDVITWTTQHVLNGYNAYSPYEMCESTRLVLHLLNTQASDIEAETDIKAWALQATSGYANEDSAWVTALVDAMSVARMRELERFPTLYR